jgi:succinate dehydrogenase/fumarate reductase flavoprotein subunit
VQREVFPIERNFFRDEPTLRSSISRLDEVWRELNGVSGDGDGWKMATALRAREAAAMAATARWIYASALQRTESRGIHRRRDHPGLDPPQTRSLMTGGLDAPFVRIDEAVR